MPGVELRGRKGEDGDFVVYRCIPGIPLLDWVPLTFDSAFRAYFPQDK